MEDKSFSGYKGKKVLITGGAGFMGSNLAHALVALGADVVALDSLHPLYGGNTFNFEGIKDKIQFINGDIRNEKLMNELVRGKDLIFNFAAQVSHTDSLRIPFEDVDISCRGLLVILEACRNFNRDVKIIFPSSRLVFGKTKQNPLSEDSPVSPLELYAAHKLTAENYLMVYYKEFGIKPVILRIANPYGIRQQIKHSKYSLPGWFMRLAMDGQVIKVFGDGNQLRDFIYVSDLIDAFLLVGLEEKVNGHIFNCGSGNSYKFKDMVESIIKIVGNGKMEYVPWPENYGKIETGDSTLDISKLKSFVNWNPKVGLEEGVRRMFDYYKKYRNNYI